MIRLLTTAVVLSFAALAHAQMPTAAVDPCAERVNTIVKTLNENARVTALKRADTEVQNAALAVQLQEMSEKLTEVAKENAALKAAAAKKEPEKK